MAGIVELDHLRGAEMLDPAVLFGIGGPAVGAVKEQRRTDDRRPQRFDVVLRQVEHRPDVQIIVELPAPAAVLVRSEEHTSELQSLMRISYAVFCLKKKNKYQKIL